MPNQKPSRSPRRKPREVKKHKKKAPREKRRTKAQKIALLLARQDAVKTLIKQVIEKVREKRSFLLTLSNRNLNRIYKKVIFCRKKIEEINYLYFSGRKLIKRDDKEIPIIQAIDTKISLFTITTSSEEIITLILQQLSTLSKEVRILFNVFSREREVLEALDKATVNRIYRKIYAIIDTLYFIEAFISN